MQNITSKKTFLAIIKLDTPDLFFIWLYGTVHLVAYLASLFPFLISKQRTIP
ncbi:MAG: hypothetical protein VW622_08475 [Opitutae bacterium]